jgi:hypothetical protein
VPIRENPNQYGGMKERSTKLLSKHNSIDDNHHIIFLCKAFHVEMSVLEFKRPENMKLLIIN